MPSVPNNAINLFSTNYGIVTFDGVGAFTTVAPSASGNVLTSNGSKWVSSAPATSGTVTSVSVVSANGLAGTVATSTSTPAITLSTTITGVLSGNGTAITGSSITQFDVLVGGASNAISSVGPGTSGQILQSAGNAANPAYSTSTYPTTNAVNTLLYASSANVMAALATATTAVLTTSSGVPTWASELSLALGGTNANLTASNGGIFYSTASAGAILSGTATASKMLLSGASTTPTWSTSTIPTSAGATANKVLLSDGTNYVLSTPTFPNASATTGNIIISDGTNWIASTPTYPAAAGSSGNVLTSNGTNWTSAAPATSGTVTTVSVVSANGLAGTVANANSAPAITLSTTITGVLSGNGTSITGSAVTNHGVVVAGASNALSSVAPGASGNVLQSNGTDWVSASGITGDITAVGDVASGAAFTGTQGTTLTSTAAGFSLLALSNGAGVGGPVSLTGGATSNAASNGGTASLSGGAGNTSGNGGLASVIGGAAGGTGDGGSVKITAAAGGATSGNGGNVVITSGGVTSGTTGTVAINSGLTVDTTGRMTNAAQPSFLAILGSNDANSTGSGATYILGNVTALTEIFDRGNNFNTNGTFTAPVTGVYCLSVTILASTVPAGSTSMQIQIVTSNRTYVSQTSGTLVANGGGNASLTLTTLADMDAADTARCNLLILGGAGNTATAYGSTSIVGTMFSGYLVC